MHLGEIITIDMEKLLQNFSTEFSDVATSSPWECVINICSNGGNIYIMDKILTKDNLNIANLM